MNNEQNSYQQIAWIKALNKQGFITCCQLIDSMKYYVKNEKMNISYEEEKWFTKFSYYFLFALQNAPTPGSEKVGFCEECLEFYLDWKKTVESNIKQS